MPTPTNMRSLHSDKFDDASFQILFRECFVPFCAWYQYKFGFSADTAKEVVHIGFIKLWENRHSVAPGTSAKAYLRKTITNTALDMLKHEKVKLRHVSYIFQHQPQAGIEPYLDHIDFKQLSADIAAAIAELPDQMRRIFECSRNEGLKYSEIAGRLQISVKTVETQMSRALVKLRSRLARYLSILLLALFLKI